MKGRVVVLDTGRAALVVDGRLEDLVVDGPGPSVGDIAQAKVTRALGGKGGAFVDFAGGSGFLREAKGLKAGAEVLVQVVSLPEPGKAAVVSARVLYKGPRLILTPGAPGVNVSRQIKDEDERARLMDGGTAALEASGAQGCGLILRSAAEFEEGAYLQRELEALAARMGQTRAERAVDFAAREWVFPLPDQIIAARGFDGFDWNDDRLSERVVRERDPFEAAGVWDEVEALKSPHVPLTAGSMFVEATRALVAVDVNTGGDFSPAAGLKANIAAAREIPRALRLRGLGGQIALDFAPMPRKERKTLEGALKAAFRRDSIETQVIGWTAMGLFELVRKRERRILAEVL